MNSGFYSLDCLTGLSSGRCLDIILKYARILVTSNLFVTLKKRIHEFTNSRMKINKQGLDFF